MEVVVEAETLMKSLLTTEYVGAVPVEEINAPNLSPGFVFGA
jgi:hypothetical protein